MKHFLLPLAILLAVSCANHQTPKVIGISCGLSDGTLNTLQTNYVEAVKKAGGLPVIMPTVADSAQAAQTVALMDGVIFSGGEDIDPSYYGETPVNETVYVNPIRDRSDMWLAKEALRQGKPIMGICRGEQLMNVVLGGSLYQDIPSQIGVDVIHAKGASHRIGVIKGSVLSQVFGQDSLSVNSFHHQAVKQAGKGVTVTAYAPDGVVEAYEAPGIIAVQFHPEKCVANGDMGWLKLFEYYLNTIR